LLLGIGSGRNVPALLAGGARLDVVEEDAERARAAAVRFAGEPRVRIARARYAGPLPFSGGFGGALSTHALLHGTPRAIAAAIAAVRNRLSPGGPFYATLGTKTDPRYGSGTQLERDVFAPLDGSEAGVAHAYFDDAGARALFAGFRIVSLVETCAAESAGRWAHTDDEAARLVHWFVRAIRL
jgi:hypothetical protein